MRRNKSITQSVEGRPGRPRGLSVLEAQSAAFVRANTALAMPPLVPEIDLHLATEVVPLWHKTERELAAEGVSPPYWAFAWAGGQALARYVLDHRETVAARSVLDFGTGSGLVAIAAAKSGARVVTAADIDAFAAAAIGLNCRANGITCRVRHASAGPGCGGRGEKVEIVTEDIIGRPCAWDVILVGDMCYERPLADRLLPWLRSCARDGAAVLLGDPGRAYFPQSLVRQLANYKVRTSRELEDREIRETGVYRLDERVV